MKNIKNNFDRKRIPKNVPPLYKSISITWSEISEYNGEEPNEILNQCIWNNRYIQIGGNSIFYEDFCDLNINNISDLYDDNSEINWELSLKLGKNNIELGKIKAKQLYQWFIEKKFQPPTAQNNLNKRINNNNPLDWSGIYKRIYTTSIDTYSRFFQYKILNNILYLNRNLHRFKILNNSSCSFCSLYLETMDHFFVKCVESKTLYFEIKDHFEKNGINLPESNLINILLGVDDTIVNYILLSFKLLLYKSRDKDKIPTLSLFKNILKQNKKIEYKTAKSKDIHLKHNNKWSKISLELV